MIEHEILKRQGIVNTDKMKRIYTVEIQDYTRSQEKSTTNGTKNSEEFKHVDEGWSWVVMFASFCACCLIGANNYGTGIIHEILLQRYQESISLTSWSGALQLGMMCVSGKVYDNILFSALYILSISEVKYNVLGSLSLYYVENKIILAARITF